VDPVAGQRWGAVTPEDHEAYGRLKRRGVSVDRTVGAAELERALDSGTVPAPTLPPDSVCSESNGIQVQPVEPEPFGDEVACWVWPRDEWLYSGEVALVDGNLILRRVWVGPSPTVMDDDGIPRPRRRPPSVSITSNVLRIPIQDVLGAVRRTIDAQPEAYAEWSAWFAGKGLSLQPLPDVVALARRPAIVSSDCLAALVAGGTRLSSTDRWPSSTFMPASNQGPDATKAFT
jgi:hypothetical protein